jgi:CxxC-x17-CxxC domain-containing protein
MTKRAKKAKETRENLPELVTVMTRLVERLEALEKKTDLVISRISTLPSEIQQATRNAPPPPAHTAFQQNSPARERTMYQTICADCRKNCEVPFRPTAERPVYCKACFTIRKAGHVPQNPDQGSLVPKEKRVMPVSHPMGSEVAAPKSKKQKLVRKKSSKPEKKKKK